MPDSASSACSDSSKCCILVVSVSSVPLWVGPLLHAASRMKKSDRLKRRKVYRLIQRQLLKNGVGCSTCVTPTYVYPSDLKEMVRSAFPKDVCDYNDPAHKNVVAITMDELKMMEMC